MMPRIDGIEVCAPKADTSLPFMPIIMVTARADLKRHCSAPSTPVPMNTLTKPVDQASLVARVKSMLRIKALHDTAQEQAARLEVQAEQLAEWNQHARSSASPTTGRH